ncbi:MAG: restriction endonuclease subunit S, partial [Sphaerospermopsis kisseleviana]
MSVPGNSDLKVNQEFIYYIFYSGQPYLGLGKMGTQLNLNTETVGGITIGFPPLEEQEKIARFLDYKTKQIDELIAKKETLIEKLDEKRTSLISHAVTKGLDVNVSMKDSGIEWLGDIPKHWQQKRFKFAVYLINNKIEAEDSNLPYMGLEHIESWTGKRIEDENASSEGIGSHFLPDDVLFGKLRPYLAKVYLSEIEGLASTEALVLRSKKYINPK